MTEPRSGPVFVAVGGGKGGVGKSFVASSLALAVARRDPAARVVAVDLDLGGSNLNLFFGEGVPRRELGDFLEGRVDSLDAVAVDTPLRNLRCVAGSFDLVTAGNPLRQRKLDLIRALVGLDADVVVLDLPAGSAPATLDFFFLGDFKIVVTNPEAAALHDAYGFLKNYLLRRLLTELRDRQEVLWTVLEYFRTVDGEGDRTITGMVETLREAHPEAWPEVMAVLEEDAPLLVLNRMRRSDEEVYLERFRAVVRKHLGLYAPSLGAIPEEKRVAEAVREGRPFVLAHPKHAVARRFDAWAARIARR